MPETLKLKLRKLLSFIFLRGTGKVEGEALNTLSFVMNNTRFENAFVIKVVNGERVGEGFRGWDEEEEEFEEEESANDEYDGF